MLNLFSVHRPILHILWAELEDEGKIDSQMGCDSFSNSSELI